MVLIARTKLEQTQKAVSASTKINTKKNVSVDTTSKKKLINAGAVEMNIQNCNPILHQPISHYLNIMATTLFAENVLINSILK